MFLAHYAVSFAAKKVVPRASLGLLVLAGQWLDLIWPIFVLRGLEWFSVDPGITRFTPLNFEHYPYSHSLLAVLGWSVLLGGIVFAAKREWKIAAMTALLVSSHWFLDYLVHRPDLPLTIGGQTKLGLGLWNHVAVTVLLEIVLFVGGVVLYVRSTKARDGVGLLQLSAFITLLAVTFVMNALGPPPDDTKVIAWASMTLWILPLWAWRLDRRRSVAGA